MKYMYAEGFHPRQAGNIRFVGIFFWYYERMLLLFLIYQEVFYKRPSSLLNHAYKHFFINKLICNILRKKLCCKGNAYAKVFLKALVNRNCSSMLLLQGKCFREGHELISLICAWLNSENYHKFGFKLEIPVHCRQSVTEWVSEIHPSGLSPVKEPVYCKAICVNGFNWTKTTNF